MKLKKIALEYNYLEQNSLHWCTGANHDKIDYFGIPKDFGPVRFITNSLRAFILLAYNTSRNHDSTYPCTFFFRFPLPPSAKSSSVARMKSLKLYDDLLTSTKAVRLNPGASSRLARQRGPLMKDNKRLLWLLNRLTATVHVMNGRLF